MTQKRKPDLLGFLFGALDHDEQTRTESEIDKSPELGMQAGKLRRSLKRIALDCRPDHDEPPPNLAENTCLRIWDQMQPGLSEVSASELQATSNRSLADVAVAIGLMVIAVAVLLPALQASRFNAGVVACQNKLKDVGTALLAYSEMQPNNRFPSIDIQGNRAAAGIYAPVLISNKLVTDSNSFYCPQSIRLTKVTNQGVPTLDEIDEAVGDTLDDLKSRMGGTYGYSLGYIDNDRYVPPKNHGRENFALLGDAPRKDGKRRMTSNHGGRGQNFFFEDGHVKFFKQLPNEDVMDNPFVNQKGYVAAGVNWTDSVLGTSSDIPFTKAYADAYTDAIPEVIRVSLPYHR